MEDLESVKTLLNSLANSLSELQPKLSDNLLSKNLNELIHDLSNNQSSNSNPLDKVNLYNTYAYVLTSLYFVYLKSSGLNNKNDHPIMQELSRVKSYIDRAKNAVNKDEEDENTRRVNTDAAQRFIKSQLGNSEPAVSKVHFEGKHTKFNENPLNETINEGNSRSEDEVRNINETVNSNNKKKSITKDETKKVGDKGSRTKGYSRSKGIQKKRAGKSH